MSARLILLLAAALFLFRGPLRARSNYVNDFAAPYACGRLWIQGHNPYDPAAFFPTWRAAGAPQGPVYANPSSIRPVYPPPSILVLLPLSLLPWPLASSILTLITTLAYVAASVLFSRLLPGSWSNPRKPLFLAYALALAPVHSAMHVSNLACLSAGLLFLALYRLLRHSGTAASSSAPSQPALDLPAACLLVISFCIKPTLAPLVLLVLGTWRHWKTLAVTLCLAIALLMLSLYPLLRQGPQWYSDLRANVHFVFSLGTANLSETNLTRFDRIDLQLPFYAIAQSRMAAGIAAAAVTGLLLLVWLQTSTRLFKHSPVAEGVSSSTRPGQSPLDARLLSLSTLLLIGLLPFYQRFYSAMLLLPLAVWSFRNLSRLSGRWTLAICSVFLVNTEVLQQKIGIVPAGSHQLSFLQNAFLGPHLNWLLLLSAIALLLLQLPVSTQQHGRLPPETAPL